MNPVFISRYRILEEVGRGGMGVVYKAEDPRLERIIAVKTLPPKLIRNKEALRRFIREAKVAAKLDHPNIIPIYDVGEDNGVYFMVMEYLEGSTLREWLESRKTIDLTQTVEILTQIAQALDYAHKRKVIHRDVKPDNVMILPNHTIKVMDFGIAVMDDRHSVTQQGAVLGTLAYLSPEQAEGKQSDARSDIYSLGIVIFESLTGRLPFEAGTPSEMIAHHLSTPAPPPSQFNAETPADLDRLVIKTLEKDPEKRYQTVSELLHDLSQIRAGKPGDAFTKFRPAVERLQKDSPVMRNTLIAEGGDISHISPPSDILRDVVARYREGKYEEAVVLLKQIWSKEPGLAEVQHYLGLCSLKLDRPHEALSFFRKAVELDPQRIASWEILGDTAMKLGEHLEALQSYQLAADISPTCGLCLKKAEALEVLGRLEDAKGAILQGLRSEPGSRKALIAAARVEIKREKHEEAVAAVHELIRLDPNDPDAHRLLGEIYSKTNRYNQALDAYQKALSASPGDSRTLEQLGDLHEKENRHEEAMAHLTKAVEIHPGNADAYEKLAKLYLKQKDDKTAMTLLEKAAELNPKSARLRKELGMLHLKQNNLDSAMAQFEKAVSVDPKDAEAHSRLGQIYFKRDQTARSVASYKTALQLDPYNAEFHEGLGMIYYVEENLEPAVDEMQRAVALDPANPDYRKALGVMYEAQGRLDLARKEYQKVADDSPKDALAQGLLGRVYSEQGLTHLAIYQLQKSLDIEPRSHLMQSLLGKAYLQTRQYDPAIAAFQKALKTAPNAVNPRARAVVGRNYYYLGKCFMEKQDSRQAAHYLKEACALLPDDQKSIQLLAKAELLSGESRHARALLEKASQLFPGDAEIWFDLALARYHTRDANGAMAAASQAAAAAPEDAACHGLLGDLALESGRLDEAAAAYGEALRLEKDERHSYHHKLGSVYFQKQDYMDAAAQFKAASLLAPENWEYHESLARAYGAIGKPEEALEELESAKKFAPNPDTLIFLQGEIEKLPK